MTVYKVHTSMFDDFSRPVTQRLEIDAVDLATAIAAANDLVTNTQAALSGLGVRHQLVGVQSYIGQGAVADTNRGQVCTFLWDLGLGKRATTKLRGIDVSLFDGQGNLDVANADVIAYEAAMVADFLISDGEPIVGLLSGKLDK